MIDRLLRSRGWLVALMVVLALFAGDDALARIGGGQNYGRGGGGGGSSGGGGGGEIELLFLLFRLCIEYPAIGVPLTLVVVAFLVIRGIASNIGGRRVHQTHGTAPYQRSKPRRKARRGVAGLERLRGADPAFSLPVLYDFLVLLHRRTHGALGSKAWEPLAPFVSESGRRDLTTVNPSVNAVSEVVVGAVRLLKVQHRGHSTSLRVRFESTRLEKLDTGADRRVLVEEEWQLRRAANAPSLSPDEVMRMGCPSCGVSIETTTMGACPNCDTPITKGQLQWQLTGVRLNSRRRVQPPEVGLWQGGDEGSVREPTLVSDDLSAAMRGLTSRHPEFDLPAFESRVQELYLQLQNGWSEGRWEDLRPFVTDPMYQSLRFWIEGYRRHGLRNQLTDIHLERQRIVRVQVDPWYEAITVRIWGSMKDSVVDSEGKVVGGNAKVARSFSEYWTFLRAAGTGGAVGDIHHCPSCGAPLDNVSQAGICGYCDSKITTGRFDWVLSRIDQPEAYSP